MIISLKKLPKPVAAILFIVILVVTATLFFVYMPIPLPEFKHTYLVGERTLRKRESTGTRCIALDFSRCSGYPVISENIRQVEGYMTLYEYYSTKNDVGFDCDGNLPEIYGNCFDKIRIKYLEE